MHAAGVAMGTWDMLVWEGGGGDRSGELIWPYLEVALHILKERVSPDQSQPCNAEAFCVSISYNFVL